MSTSPDARYSGPIKAVILDWAGTVVDFGCCAPAAVFIEVFRRKGIEITQAQARGPMGMHKRDHIRILSQLDDVAAQWHKLHGSRPSETDVEEMFAEFVPLQVEAIARHADVIPGALDAIATLRAKGISIGSTTGYNEAMMAKLIPLATRAGYSPDCIVTVSDVQEGRPFPWMALEAASRLGVYPMAACVKVGDTVADIHEGLNAGMWSVGVVEHGNEVGLTSDEFQSLSPEVRTEKCTIARKRLEEAGAHFVLDSIRELPACIEVINSKQST
ncbi:MAG TPA: phosphonoacetaldehyde hydrolase [Candidatus Hydrogenedentes bacterium]|nr:phosphonoacetaldehyde hydrolase [Candidatus Hydrogenedentota bacterium]